MLQLATISGTDGSGLKVGNFFIFIKSSFLKPASDCSPLLSSEAEVVGCISTFFLLAAGRPRLPPPPAVAFLATLADVPAPLGRPRPRPPAVGLALDDFCVFIFLGFYWIDFTGLAAAEFAAFGRPRPFLFVAAMATGD